MSLSITEAELPGSIRSNASAHLGSLELSASLRPSREPRLHFRLAPLHRKPRGRHQRSDGSHLDRLPSLDRRGGGRRDDRHRQGARGAGRPPPCRAERLRGGARRQEPPPVQARHGRPHYQGRPDHAGVRHRRACAAAAVQPMARRRPSWRARPHSFNPRALERNRGAGRDARPASSRRPQTQLAMAAIVCNNFCNAHKNSRICRSKAYVG